MQGRPWSFTALLALVLGATFVLAHLQTPWRVLLPALVPALLQGALFFWLAGPRRDARVLIASFASGAIAAVLIAAPLNQVLAGLLGAEIGADRSRAIFPLLAAPLVEEAAKGVVLAALLLARPAGAEPVREAIVCGALVGVGFATTENMDYLLLTAVLGGAEHLPLMMYQRLLGSLSHPVFTATLAAGIGWARTACSVRGRALAIAAGAVGAVVQHVFWNGVTSGSTQSALCGSTVIETGGCSGPDAASVLVVVPLIIAVSLAPGAIAVALVARRARRSGLASDSEH